MGLDRFRTTLKQHNLIALDSSIFIYQIEANPRYVPLSDIVFSWLGAPTARAVTASITMTEILVPPYRTFNQKLIDCFYSLLATYPNLNWISIDLAAFITNDPVFRRVKGFTPIILDDFL